MTVLMITTVTMTVLTKVIMTVITTTIEMVMTKVRMMPVVTSLDRNSKLARVETRTRVSASKN